MELKSCLDKTAFCAQARIRKFTADAACGPRGGQGISPSRSNTDQRSGHGKGGIVIAGREF